VFARVAQQTLQYLNVPHDTEINERRRQLLRASVKPDEIIDSSPDRLGDAAIAENESSADEESSVPHNPSVPTKPSAAHVIPASVKTSPGQPPAATLTSKATPRPSTAATLPQLGGRGTVVVDIGGSTVAPSLLGLPVRNALETAQQAGIEIDIVGSGVAREQFPPPGAHLAPGAHISVRFAR